MSRSMRDEAAAVQAEKAKAAEQADAARQEALQGEVESPLALADQAIATVQAADEAVAEALEAGLKESTAITFGSLLPTPTWAASESLGKARGLAYRLGRITGTVTGTERKQTMFGGKLLESIALLGDFYAIAELREKEIIHGTMLFLTNGFSGQIEKALSRSADTGEVVSIELEAGFETTGKSPVSYAWTIHHYLNGGTPSKALRDLLTPRSARRGKPPVPALTMDPGPVLPGILPIQKEIDAILANAAPRA